MPAPDTLPYSQACDNNKSVILRVLAEVFAGRRRVLEIGSGTGQHACHFAARLPWLTWQPTELAENLPLLRPRCERYDGDNLLSPQALDVRENPWPLPVPDAVFTANSLHIMAPPAVAQLFAGLARQGGEELVVAIYGPFNYGGHYTSASNARFDQWLAQRHPDSAIRDFEEIDRLAAGAGLKLHGDHDMPANNRLLVWCRQG
jgi:SAM-dependent methyltransferase